MGEKPLEIAQAQSAEYLDYYTHYFVSGNRDLYKFGIPAIALDQTLRSYGIEHFFELEEGEHDSPFYLPYVIDAFAYQTAAMPSITSINAETVIGGGTIKASVSKGKASVETQTAVTDAVKDYLAVIPASEYTKNTAPDLTIPVTVTISRNGKVILTQTKCITAKEAKTETLNWNMESQDIRDGQKYDIKVTASVMDQTVVCGESQAGIESVDMKDTAVTVAKAAYTGKAVKPKVTVTYQGKTLVKGTDYTLAYSNNKKAGQGQVIVTGQGSYTGSVTAAFTIVPNANKITKATNTKGRKLTVKYTKAAGAKGYQIVYAANRNFKSAKKKQTAKTTVTLTNLTKGKTYYVKVRSYITVNNKKVFSGYSNTVKKKVTK